MHTHFSYLTSQANFLACSSQLSKRTSTRTRHYTHNSEAPYKACLQVGAVVTKPTRTMAHRRQALLEAAPMAQAQESHRKLHRLTTTATPNTRSARIAALGGPLPRERPSRVSRTWQPCLCALANVYISAPIQAKPVLHDTVPNWECTHLRW